MGKKDKTEGRTKGNLQPASSQRASELLAQRPGSGSSATATSLVGMASLGGFGGYIGSKAVNSPDVSSPRVRSPVTDYSGPSSNAAISSLVDSVDASVRFIFKKIIKKDVNTKLKALNELYRKLSPDDTSKGPTKTNTTSSDDSVVYLSDNEVTELCAVWCAHYTRLSSDSEKRVRELTSKIHLTMVTRLGKNIAPYIKSIIGSWLLSKFDPSQDVRHYTSRSLDAVFPNRSKVVLMLNYCRDEIYTSIYDIIFTHTPETLGDDLSPNVEEMNAKYERMVSSAFAVVAFILGEFESMKLSGKPNSNETQTDKPAKAANFEQIFIENVDMYYDGILNTDRFWTFSSNSSPIIREAVYSALPIVMTVKPNIVSDNMETFAKLIGKMFDETVPRCYKPIVVSLPSILKTHGQLWSMGKVKNKFLKSFISSGLHANGTTLSHVVLPLFAFYLKDVGTNIETVSSFFDSLWKGLLANLLDSRATTAMAKAFMECWWYCSRHVMKNASEDEELLKLILPLPVVKFTSIYLSPDVDAQLARTLRPAVWRADFAEYSGKLCADRSEVESDSKLVKLFLDIFSSTAFESCITGTKNIPTASNKTIISDYILFLLQTTGSLARLFDSQVLEAKLLDLLTLELSMWKSDPTADDSIACYLKIITFIVSGHILKTFKADLPSMLFEFISTITKSNGVTNNLMKLCTNIMTLSVRDPAILDKNWLRVLNITSSFPTETIFDQLLGVLEIFKRESKLAIPSITSEASENLLKIIKLDQPDILSTSISNAHAGCIALSQSVFDGSLLPEKNVKSFRDTLLGVLKRTKESIFKRSALMDEDLITSATNSLRILSRNMCTVSSDIFLCSLQLSMDIISFIMPYLSAGNVHDRVLDSNLIMEDQSYIHDCAESVTKLIESAIAFWKSIKTKISNKALIDMEIDHIHSIITDPEHCANSVGLYKRMVLIRDAYDLDVSREIITRVLSIDTFKEIAYPLSVSLAAGKILLEGQPLFADSSAYSESTSYAVDYEVSNPALGRGDCFLRTGILCCIMWLKGGEFHLDNSVSTIAFCLQTDIICRSARDFGAISHVPDIISENEGLIKEKISYILASDNTESTESRVYDLDTIIDCFKLPQKDSRLEKLAYTNVAYTAMSLVKGTSSASHGSNAQSGLAIDFLREGPFDALFIRLWSLVEDFDFELLWLRLFKCLTQEESNGMLSHLVRLMLEAIQVNIKHNTLSETLDDAIDMVATVAGKERSGITSSDPGYLAIVKGIVFIRICLGERSRSYLTPVNIHSPASGAVSLDSVGSVMIDDFASLLPASSMQRLLKSVRKIFQKPDGSIIRQASFFPTHEELVKDTWNSGFFSSMSTLTSETLRVVYLFLESSKFYGASPNDGFGIGPDLITFTYQLTSSIINLETIGVVGHKTLLLDTSTIAAFLNGINVLSATRSIENNVALDELAWFHRLEEDTNEQLLSNALETLLYVSSKHRSNLIDTTSRRALINLGLLAEEMDDTTLFRKRPTDQLIQSLNFKCFRLQVSCFNLLRRIIVDDVVTITFNSSLDAKDASDDVITNITDSESNDESEDSEAVRRGPFSLPKLLIDIISEENLDLDALSTSEEAQLSAATYIFAWYSIFSYFTITTFQLKQHLVRLLRDIPECTKRCFSFIVSVMGLENVNTIYPLNDIDFVELSLSSLSLGSDLLPKVPGKNISQETVGLHAVRILTAHLLWLFLKETPSLARVWWVECRNRNITTNMETFVSMYYTPKLVHIELENVLAANIGNEIEDLSVKTNERTRAVAATFAVEDTALEMVLRLPAAYPLKQIDVRSGGGAGDGEVSTFESDVSGTNLGSGRAAGIPDNKWRAWMLAVSSVLLSQNGSIADAIMVFGKNASMHYKGIEECAICYATIGVLDRSLPNKACRTCKKKFHSSCVYKWFKKSGQASCPMCRQLF